jgi:hypothetical protein
MCSCFISASAALQHKVQQPFKTEAVRKSWFCRLMVFWTRSKSKINDKFVSCSCISSLHSPFSLSVKYPRIFALPLLFSLPLWIYFSSFLLFLCHISRALLFFFLMSSRFRLPTQTLFSFFSSYILSWFLYFFFIISFLSSITFYSCLLLSSFSPFFFFLRPKLRLELIVTIS